MYLVENHGLRAQTIESYSVMQDTFVQKDVLQATVLTVPENVKNLYLLPFVCASVFGNYYLHFLCQQCKI